jgi:hypothetical protein
MAAAGSKSEERKEESHTRQVIGSLLAAVLIVALAVAIVTAKLGPGPDSRELRELRAQREERLEERQDELEDRQENGGQG